VIDLVPHLGTAVPAPILVSVPIREHQEEKLVYRDRSPATGAVEFGGIQFSKVLPGLSFILRGSGSRTLKAERVLFHCESLGFDMEVVIIYAMGNAKVVLS
jgi:hypothetical protein